MRNLLIGNGVNLINNDLFGSKKITQRIKDLLPLAFEYFGFQNNVRFIKDIDDNFDFDDYSGSVEELLYDCCKVVINIHKEEYFKTLSRAKFFELVTLLKKVFINAIFIKDNISIKPNIPNDIIKCIKSFDNIFSLNYIEFWDQESRVQYLHGKIEYQEFRKEDFGIDTNRMEYDIDYAFAMEMFLNDFYYFPIRNLEDLLMLPIKYNIDKNIANNYQKKYRIDGFLTYEYFEKKEVIPLYDNLNDLDNITIFGTSPFGDEFLLEKLKNISDVTVYVYNLRGNIKESQEWKRKVPQVKLLDSRNFKIDY